MTSKRRGVFFQSGAGLGRQLVAGAQRSTPAMLQSATPGPGGSSSIRRLEAKGSVVVTQKDQVVTGETAIFDTRSEERRVGNEGMSRQCKAVSSEDRLMVGVTPVASPVESPHVWV